jgi:hypothetical protein
MKSLVERTARCWLVGDFLQVASGKRNWRVAELRAGSFHEFKFLRLHGSLAWALNFETTFLQEFCRTRLQRYSTHCAFRLFWACSACEVSSGTAGTGVTRVFLRLGFLGPASARMKTWASGRLSNATDRTIPVSSSAGSIRAYTSVIYFRRLLRGPAPKF